MSRVIGIRHRVKKTAEGEARPTQVAILKDGKTINLQLETETDELDFVLGRFPTSFRKPKTDEDLSKFAQHHIHLRKLKKNESPGKADFPVKIKNEWYIVDKVPKTYEGLQSGDKVAMMLGGSGDNLAFALTRRGQEIGSTVHRISPFTIKNRAEVGVPDSVLKDRQAELLATDLNFKPELFYEVGPRDLSLIWLRECLRSRVDAMKARIACEQRLRQHLIGAIFCSPEGKFPEGDIEKQFDRAKADDKILQALTSEEGKRERELVKACEALDIYTKLFEPVVGLGPMIASRIIGAVIDIRRFETKAKLRAFCGVHILNDGRFPRRRNNFVANWNGDCRQALFLLGDQFNRRPDSVWGTRLIAAKAKYRVSHPYPVLSVKTKVSDTVEVLEYSPEEEKEILVSKKITREKETLYELREPMTYPFHAPGAQDSEGNVVVFERREGMFAKHGNGTYTVLARDGDGLREVTGLKGTLRYTNGHIHKMATWYTLGKFIEWLFKNWWKLEGATASPKSNPPADITSQAEAVA